MGVRGRSIGRRDLEYLYGPENDYDVFVLDLETAHTDLPANLAGTSLTVMSAGGAAWSMRFNDPTKAAIQSDWLTQGTVFQLQFSNVYFTNAAAPAGTAPAVFFIGRRVL